MSRIEMNPAIPTDELTERDLSHEALTTIVASLIDLHQQVKQSHWNITGSNFIGLHLLFDKFAAELNKIIDEAAERQRALGFHVQGSIKQSAALTLLPDFPAGLTRSEEIVRHLVKVYRIVSVEVNESIEPLTNAGDFGTADLFTGCVRALDLHLYLLTSQVAER